MVIDWRSDLALSWRQHLIESVARYEREALAKKKAKQAYLAGDLDKTMHHFALHLRAFSPGPSGNLGNLIDVLRDCTSGENTYWGKFSACFGRGGERGVYYREDSLGDQFAEYFQLTPEEKILAEQRRVASGKQNIPYDSWEKLRRER